MNILTRSVSEDVLADALTPDADTWQVSGIGHCADMNLTRIKWRDADHGVNARILLRLARS